MSLLEDRLVRILELRRLGKDDNEVASALELSPDIVRGYEMRVGDEIRKHPHNSSAYLSEELGISPLVVELYRGYLSNLIAESYDTALEKSQVAEDTEPDFEWNKDTIKEFRKEKGWSQKEFAGKIGGRQSTIGAWETGRSTPKLGSVVALNKLKGIDVKLEGEVKRRRGPRTITERYADRIPALCEAILGGFSTVKEFEEHIGLGYQQFTRLADRLELELPHFKTLGLQNNVRKIQELIDYGFSMGEEIAELTGISNASILLYNRMGLIKLPEERMSTKPSRALRYGIVARHKNLIDKMILEGVSQTDIAKKIHETSGDKIHRENIRQYIKKSRQYEKWDQAISASRIAKANEKVVEQDLVHTLYNITLEKADEEEYKEAIRYYLDGGNRVTPLKKSVKLVKTYKNAKEKGKKLSYQKLADRSGFNSANEVKRYLNNMGLQSLCWTASYLTPLQKNAIKGVYKIGLSSEDIAYFLDEHQQKIICNLKSRSSKKIKRNSGIQELKGIKGVRYLSYREASQIYGFTDEMNSTPEKIANALDVKVNAVELALQYREKIEPKLTKTLQILFPYERIDKPYR
mgnify:FL=1